MTLGPLMIDVAGKGLTARERERLSHPLIGGVILFTKNYEDPAQLEALVAEIRSLRNPPLLVAVDQEGGRVQRFRDGFVRLPPVRSLGHLYDRDPAAALETARELGWLMAAELRAVGVDFSFAPVVDLDRGLSAVIGDRALHADPEVVAALALAMTDGMRSAGMAAVAKHFPAHGGAVADSHVAMAVDRREFVDLLDDMLPYERLIRAGLQGVMMAHVAFPAVDPLPASYSAWWIRRQLREQMGFRGAVFSDDLSMRGAAGPGGPVARARAALAAGTDMLLVCNDTGAVDEILAGLADYVHPPGQLHLVRLRGRGGLTRASLAAEARWSDASRLVDGLDAAPELVLDG